MKKTYILIAVVVIVGAGVFYGGFRYGQSKNSAANFSMFGLQNMTPEQRQQRSGSNNFPAGRSNGVNGQNGTFLNGEIISRDNNSITVKLPDGGSKIIFISDATSINKSTVGAVADLETGKQITINGSANSDGSITAQFIQIRPDLPDQAGAAESGS